MNHRFMASVMLGVMSCAQAPAQAADAVSVSTTISDFSYKVDDLSATDGIDPYFAFTAKAGDGLKLYVGDIQADGFTYQATKVVNEASVVLPGVLFEPNVQTLTVPGANAQAAKAGTTFNVTSAFTTEELSNVLSSSPVNLSASQSSDVYLVQDRTARISTYQQPSGSGSGLNPSLSYTLGANTSVTFTAVVNTAFNIDLLSLAGTPGLARVLGLPVTGDIEVKGLSVLSIQGGFVDGQSVMFRQNQYLDAKLDTFGQFTSTGSTSPSQRVISLTIVNNSRAPKSDSMNLTLLSQIHLDVRPVPEPSSYALMGLGLVGLSVVARQRRAKRVH